MDFHGQKIKSTHPVDCMLINTFQHIAGIGPKTEERMWANGIRNWQRFDGERGGFKAKKAETIKNILSESSRRLIAGDPAYFGDLMPPSLHWRMYPEFRRKVVYLDIETTGLESTYAEITTIATYDGKKIRHYVNGQNLEDFTQDIRQYNLIVSYNGKSFDVPFINDYFGVKLDQAHIDLRHVLASLGYRGGLKACEKAAGIDRGDAAGIDGFFAVLLWHDYINRGNLGALETLLAYNIEDVINLEQLMVMAYNLKIKQTPFYDSHLIECPTLPNVPYSVDHQTVERIKNESIFYRRY